MIITQCFNIEIIQAKEKEIKDLQGNWLLIALLLNLALILEETQRQHRQEPFISHSETTGSSILLIKIYVITDVHNWSCRDSTNVEISATPMFM